jgi:hypothetical protein
MDIINKTSLTEENFLKLKLIIPNTTSLLDLMSWTSKKKISVVDVIKQDEYSLDVIFSVNNLFIICGTT